MPPKMLFRRYLFHLGTDPVGGITQFAEGEPKYLNPTFCSPFRRREAARAEGQGYVSKPAFSALPTSNQEPTLSVRNYAPVGRSITAFQSSSHLTST